MGIHMGGLRTLKVWPASEVGSVLWRIKLLTCGVVSAINELQYSSQGGNKIISQNENHLGNSNSSVILGRNSLVIPKTNKKRDQFGFKKTAPNKRIC